MSAFSDIHYQSWQAFHNAMLSDIPMSVLHPGYPPASPHVEDRGEHLSWSEEVAMREEEEYYAMGDPDEYSEEYELEDMADEWPVPLGHQG